MDVIHTAIRVADRERTEEFYVEGLGLEHKWEFTMDGVDNVYLGGDYGEIQCKYDPEADDDIEHGNALDHIALSVDSTDETFERVRGETGCPVVKEPTTMADLGLRIAFVEDPDGYVVELVEELD